MLMCGRHRSIIASAGVARTDSLDAAAAAAAWDRPAQQSGAIASTNSYSKTVIFWRHNVADSHARYTTVDAKHNID